MYRLDTPRLTDGVSQQPSSRRYRSQAEEAKNCMLRILDGLDKRNGSVHLATLLSSDVDKFRIHWVDRDDDHQYVFITKDADSTGTNRLRCFDLSSGTEIHVEDSASASAGGTLGGSTPLFTYLASSTEPYKDFQYLTVADTTFVLDRRTTVAMNSSYKTASATVQPYGKGFVFIKQGAYSTDYILTIKHGSTTTTLTTSTWSGSGTPAVGEIQSINTHDIAADLDTKINAIAGISSTRNGPVLEIVGDNGSNIITEMTAVDGLGNAAMSLLFDTITTATDLPLICRDGFKIKVGGDPAIGGDDYYIKFVADTASAFGPGSWEQTIAHDTEYLIANSTMPHKLVRKVGTGAALGSGYTVPLNTTYFEFSKIDWNERTVGDSEFNPDPSFVGNTIQNMSMFKNRLCFETDNDTIMSEVNVFYNFFRTDMVNLLDSDVIDVSNGYPAVTITRWAVPFESDLILFSDRNQFRIPGTDVVTPKTVGILPCGSHKMDYNCEPVPSGTGLMFVVKDGGSTRLMEMYRRGNSELFDAVNLSEQCPSYILGEVQEITISPEIELAALVSTDPSPFLYMYQYHWSGESKVQSAWHYWDFGEDAVVRSAKFYRDRLYLVITRGTKVCLEYIDLGFANVDYPQNYRLKMDRRFSVSTGTFNLMDNTTRFTIPYTLGDNEILQAVTASTETPGGLAVAIDSYNRASNYVYVKGDYSAIDVFLGVQYEMAYTFGDLLVKESTDKGERAILDGPCQIIRGLISYEDSGPFRVDVELPYKTFSYPFTGRKLGYDTLGAFTSTQPISSGEFEFPVMTDGRTSVIKIINDRPFPSKIQKVEWFIAISPTAKGLPQ